MDAGATVFILAHLALGEVLVVLALVMAASGLDDLFVDLVFLGRSARLRLARAPRPEIASLRAVPPAPMAMIIPAWDEVAVIGAMPIPCCVKAGWPGRLRARCSAAANRGRA